MPIKSENKLYFKRAWNDTRGDNYDYWGTSIWYFETEKNGVVIRQIEVYENGPSTKYCMANKKDKYGELSWYPLDLVNFQSFKIKKIEFERVWITVNKENY